MQSTEAKVYKSKNLFESAFLHFKGFSILSKEPIGDRKWLIVFEESPELLKAAQGFYTKSCKERQLFESFRLLKDFIFDHN
jgi:hypothetical protein